MSGRSISQMKSSPKYEMENEWGYSENNHHEKAIHMDEQEVGTHNEDCSAATLNLESC
jgi:hypothetical protein